MMRKLMALLCLTATQAPTLAHAEWTQIRTAAEFNSQVVGNAYVNPKDDSWFRFNANGTLEGGAFGQALTGNWNFNGGFACYNRALGGNPAPSDCIIVQVDGRNLVTMRDRGRGSQAVYVRN